MPQNIPWSEVSSVTAIVTLVIVLTYASRTLRYIWKEAKPFAVGAKDRWEQHLDRQEDTASKQHAVCNENVSLNTDTNHGVRSQNKAILEMLHGARIGLGQANLLEQPRRQIEERLGEAERIIREAG